MDFPQQLQACVEQANEALRRFIAPQPFQNTPLVEAMHYGALLGGKRLRPFLVYATGEMFGVSRTTLDAPAAAVECIHAYSLMHDDLPAMDDDDLRRGLPTCHIKFGEANAILAGDALQTLAFSILSDAPMTDVPDRDRLAMVSELAQASGVAGMCGGQALDLQAEGQQVNLQALERIHRHKTGALIRAAVRMGALSAGERGRAALPALDRYAENIGLAREIGTEDFARTMPEYCGVISKSPTVKAVKAKIEAEEEHFDFSILDKVVEEASNIDIREIAQQTEETVVEVETVNGFGANDAILDIRSIDEQEDKPLKVEGVEVVSLPFYKLSTKFGDLDQSKTWLLWCERGVMSRLQALYLREQGFSNVKVYRP